MGSQRKIRTRLVVVALAVSGLGVASAGTAQADASDGTTWRGTTLHLENVSVSAGRKGMEAGVETGPIDLPIPAGYFSFNVTGKALNVYKLRSKYVTFSTMGLERWQVKYSFMKDNPDTKQEEEYAWIWGDEHFGAAPTGSDVVRFGDRGWTAPDRGSVIAQLYVRGQPIPGARVRHQIQLLPGFHNRVEDAKWNAALKAGDGLIKVGNGVNRAISRFNPFD